VKRVYMIAAAVLVTVGLGLGCAKKTTPPVETGAEGKAKLGDVAPAPEGAVDLGTSDVAVTPPNTPAPMAPGMTGAGRIHVVQRGDTLFKLARQYYNDQSQWKRIYEANRSQIPNKDVLKVGQKLVIP
jgi:nucleoid-associated protein YgaU